MKFSGYVLVGGRSSRIGRDQARKPLCAVSHRRARNVMEANFLRGIRKVTAALEGVPTACIAVTELAHFQNVNTPEDWAGYAAD